MRIAFDIDENVYTRLFDNGETSAYDLLVLAKCVRNGKPLPKGHGDLKDADKIKTNFQEHHDFYINAYGGFKNLPRNEKARVDEITSSIATVVNAPTIIPADKESEE